MEKRARQREGRRRMKEETKNEQKARAQDEEGTRRGNVTKKGMMIKQNGNEEREGRLLKGEQEGVRTLRRRTI